MTDAAEIKRHLDLPKFLRSRYGIEFRKNAARCLFAERHKRGDARPSMVLSRDRTAVLCMAGDHLNGWADCFKVVQLKDRLDFRTAKQVCAEYAGMNVEESSARCIAMTYDYIDENGIILFQVVRYEPKGFRQRRPDGQGGWIYNLKDVRLVLYRLLDVNKAKNIFVVEGEKDADTAYRLGLPDGWAATCNPMGAGKWREEYSESLRGKRVVILPDADEPGRQHGEQVARSLQGKAAPILSVTLPHGKDLTEWAEAHGTADELKMLLEKAKPWLADSTNNQEVPWRCSLDLLVEPPSETVWLLNGLLPAQSVTLLSGREGTLKTWLALEWATAIAEGTTWLGRECESGAVLYLDAEMPEDLFKSRLHAVGGSRNLHIWRWQDANFPEKLDDPWLITAAKSHRLIVIDTLKRFMKGLKENSADDMEIITGFLRELTRWGCEVLALHHAPKDETKAGYRGSTELGAGVDVTLTIEAHAKEGTDTILEITADKTRYTNDPRLTLRVERTNTGPRFHDACGEAQAARQAALTADLDRLEDVIKDLLKNGRRPNQTEIIKSAKSLGSRNTILTWLKQGEGSRWRSETDGCSRAYELMPSCPPVPTLGGQEGLDNSPDGSPESVLLSICHEGIGENRLDNWTSLPEAIAPRVATHPLGTRIRFNGGLGFEETGIIEVLTEWSQYPGQMCYRVRTETGVRTIPQRWVLGVEGSP